MLFNLGVSGMKLHQYKWNADYTFLINYGITILTCGTYMDTMVAVFRMPTSNYKIIVNDSNYGSVFEFSQQDAYHDLNVRIKIDGTFYKATFG